jgi:fumarate reductase flavoprotein subunit
MLRLATTVAMGALARTESRGAHYRTDFPLRDDRNWLNRTLVRWPSGADEPSLSYEPTGLMELAPGHRGYGSDERIAMQCTVDAYNESVLAESARHGRLATQESPGSRGLYRADIAGDGS